MYTITILLAALAGARFIPQAVAGEHEDHHDEATEETAEVWACPMHPDVTSDEEGECSKCGMTLVKQEAHDHSSHDHGDADEATDEAAGDHDYDDEADESADDHEHGH